MKTLVLFVFHDLNERVYSFFNNCIFEDDNVDFIIISNNTSNVFELPSYVKVLKRDNIGFDFGGWSDALLTDELYKNYDYFIFANSSIIGPFLSPAFNEIWTNIYINGLQENNIKIFGSTINSCGDPYNKSYVQSYIFSMNNSTLLLLIERQIFTLDNYANTMAEIIENKEMLMSRIIIENGGNIGSLLQCQRNIDYTFSNPIQNEELSKSRFALNVVELYDVMNTKYYNRLWNEYDLVFIKGDRVPISYENISFYRNR